MRHIPTFAHVVRCVVALSGAVLLAGCAAGLERLPLPAPEAGGHSYALTAVFTNALNLPAKAKVRLYGADIGEVDSISAHNFTAHVNMRIRADVTLHVGSSAELRSATPLGDVFVQIRPSAGDAEDTALLHDGDTIALSSTTAAPTIEELLSSMALLVNGGTVRNLVSILNGAGHAVGGRGEKLGALLDQTSDLLTRMTARKDQVDAALRHTSELAATVSARQDTINASLTAGAPALNVIAENSARLADLADSIARITRQLMRFPSLQGTDTSSVITDINDLAAVLNDISVDPNLSLTAFNRLIGILMRTTNSTSANAVLSIAKLALVPLPDKNYPGDPGFHWTDGTDWHQMIGSLRYEWNLLLNRIYGPQR